MSDLPSYSSNLNSSASKKDDDKWVYDDEDPGTVLKPPKKIDNSNKHDDSSLEPIPKFLPEKKMESSSSRKSNKLSKSNLTQDRSDSSQAFLDESDSLSFVKKKAFQSAKKEKTDKADKTAKSDKPEKLSPKKAQGYQPQIQIALSGTKLAFANGVWQDVSEIDELVDKVHPIVAESIGLRKRAELLVRLIAESEYESQLIQNEINECDEIINGLKKVLDEYDTSNNTNNEEEEEGSTSSHTS